MANAEGGELAGVVAERALEHHEDREEYERGDRCHHQPNRADDEGIAAAKSAKRQPLAEKHQIARRGGQGTVSHSRRRELRRVNVGR
ncbi:MAG TPA: hypothetical protein VFO02_11070 [Burkholderiales bacterium]|nr:hypothetical protein [Burkholderiales bacterium]